MAYNGYLIKVGKYTIPNSAISPKKYKCKRTIIDLDAYRNANGELIRNALDHVPYKIELELRPMYSYELQPILKSIRENYTKASERKASVTFYDMELDKYETQDMYIPDIEFEINAILKKGILYTATPIHFVGY